VAKSNRQYGVDVDRFCLPGIRQMDEARPVCCELGLGEEPLSKAIQELSLEPLDIKRLNATGCAELQRQERNRVSGAEPNNVPGN
jgi:hypothetical protein